MLYDATGREIPEINQQLSPGRHIISAVSDRSEYDVSRGLTPVDVDRIMTAANGGNTAEQCRLAVELEEKNWDIAHAIQTRRNAVLGIEPTIEPASDSAQDKKIAAEFDAALKSAGKGNYLDSFFDLRNDLMSALLPGFAASEIVWGQGGKLAGFNFVDQHHFSFVDSIEPRLITDDNFQGIELPPGKLLLHKIRKHGNDPARGGLIRPLAWLYCFSRINVSDLLRFVERHGMPFIVAKVDTDTWENERHLVQSVIRNFGPDGGGVFTRSVEFELLQASNNTGDVYFKLLEYIGQAITKVVLGQTATAGDGGGWSNDGAQSQVRQDILEYDCCCIDSTINNQLAPLWTLYNYGAGVATPQIKTDATPPEDIKALSETVKTLYESGLEADPEEMSHKFGIKLSRRVVEDNTQNTPASVALSDDPPSALQVPGKSNADDASDDPDGNPQINSWLKPLQNAFGDDSERIVADNPDALFDTDALAELIESTIYAGYAAGIAGKASAFKKG